MRIYRIILLCFVVVAFHSTIQAQDQNFNLTFTANWDVDSLPSTSVITYNDCWGYVDCSGGEYAIMGSASYSHFFDVTDPTNPIEIAVFAGGNNTTWRDFKTYKNYSYGVCDSCNEGLQVFDMTNVPDTVDRVLQTTEFFGKSHNIFIDTLNARLYAAGTDTQGSGLVILDLEDSPESPTLLSSIDLPGGYVHDLYVRNDTAYCSHLTNGLYVYNLQDPNNPELLGILEDYPQKGLNHSSWLSNDGKSLVMADETHNTSVKLVNTEDLSDMEVSDLFRSTLLAPNDTASIVHNPFIIGDYVFLSYYHDGVQVYDISDPTNVVKAASYDTQPDNTTYSGFKGCWGVYPYLPSGTIIASDVDNGLFLFNSDALNLPQQTATLYPVDDLNIGSALNLCEDDTITIEYQGSADDISWYLDGELFSESKNIELAQAGVLTAVLGNKHCSITSAATTVELIEVPVSEPDFPSDETFCEGDTLLLNIESVYDTVQWYADGILIEQANTNTYSLTETALVSYTYGIESCLEDSEEYLFEFEALPGTALALDGFTITAEDAFAYQWYLDGEAIDGAVEQSFESTQSGIYTVELFTEGGCSVLSDALDVISSNNEVSIIGLNIRPNPLSGKELYISGSHLDKSDFKIIDINGKTIQRGIVKGNTINTSLYLPGLYFIQIYDNKSLYSARFIKE